MATRRLSSNSKNFLGIKMEDFEALRIEEEKSAEYAEEVMRDFKSLGCCVCQQHFGYQHRWDPHIILCSIGCVDITNNNVKIIQISPTCSLGKLYCVQSNKSSSQNFKENTSPRKSARTVFGHKKNLRDSPFFIRPSNDQEVPSIPPLVDEVDYYFHSQSPQLTEEIFYEALKRNLLKNKQMEQHTSSLPQRGRSKECMTHAARQTSLESLDVSTTGSHLITARNPREKRFGYAKSYRNPFAGTSRSVTKVAPTKRVWTVDDIQLSKSFVNRAACYVTHIWTNSKFTLLAAVDANKIDALEEALNNYCCSAPPLERIPLENEIVFVPYDGRYYRGKVESVEKADRVSVTLIDVGPSITTKICNCREPCTNIMKSHPMYGLVFESFLEEADSTVGTPVEVIPKLEQEVVIEIKTMSKTQWTGNLYVDAGTQRWDRILREYYFRDIVPGDYANKESFVHEVEDKQALLPVMRTSVNNMVTQIPENGYKSFETPEEPQNTTNLVSEPRSAVLNPFTTSCKLFPNKRTIYNFTLSPNLHDCAFVLVNFRWNYRKLCISARLDNEGIENLTASIELYVKTAPTMDRVPVVDEVVLAPYDGSYYRAVVKGTVGRAVHVEFLDYGDEARMLFSELLPLSAEIISHPIYSVNLISTDLPESLPFLDSPVLDEALLIGGYVKVEAMSRITWQGRLQLAESNMSWGDLVLQVLEANHLYK